MASEDDAGRAEPGRRGAGDRDDSEFGPPLSDFGPPLGDFGPPLTDFGPPTGEVPTVGWAPADAPERPTMGWQPADAPAAPPVPPPPPQYRAPDSTSTPDPRAAEPPRPAPPEPRAPEPRPAEPRRTSNLDLSRPPLAGSRGVVPRQAQQQGSSGSLWDDDDLAKKLVAARPTPSRESSSSLWDDDDLAKKLAAPRPETEAEPEQHSRNTGVLIGGLAAAFVVIVAIAAVIVFATRNNGQDNGPTAGPAASASGAADCRTKTEGNVTTGNGPGDTNSGTGAIFAFQHAYYTDRNATLARSFTAPEVNLLPAADLQKAIDEQIPRGTTYCLRIVTAQPDRFNVEITEHRPDGATALYAQVITTVVVNGRTLIGQIIW
ncbi:hypothetical protein [Nocardia blacklockiae]|uniref:hypothetical protein n=1 Tax=Nocardia blacklockiae TaxID=480036 RepID=UPI0018934E31|nr:hypothetical protein [Nocardia blacklockiae]MBF6172489.1 hypothetical protein [Nocardia blacklockiae]